MQLKSIVDFLDETFSVKKLQDFPNAWNGLQLANNGEIKKIVGAVDANRYSIEKAIEQGADLLCVHHGLFWSGAQPLVGPIYELYKAAMAANLAIYSVHLPLDSHPGYGHNVSIARHLKLSVEGTFCEYMQQPCGLICQDNQNEKMTLSERLRALFPNLHTLNLGPEMPQKIGIVSGSGGQDLLEEAVRCGIDTLITGEVRYSAVSFAQLHRLNIYACGHYNTECFGIKNILDLIANKFHVSCEFIDIPCDL